MNAITKAMPVAVLVTLGLALAAEAADTPPAADWPRWRGPDGSGMGVGCGQPLVDDLADMRLVWQSEEREIPANAWHNGTQGGYDSPIVANGRVFIGYFKGTGDIFDPDALNSGDSKAAGSERAKWNAAVVTDDIVLAVCARTGKTVWKRVLDEGINLFQRRKSGPHNAPCWHEGPASSGDGTTPRQGRVYAQSTLGRVFCLDESDGRVIWQQDIEATARQLAVRDAYKKAGRQHPYRGVEPPEFKTCGWPRLFMYPLCVADGVVVADGGVFDAATGKPMPWPKPPASNGDRNPTCPLRWTCDGQEFFIIGNQCLRPRTGEVVWRIKEAGGVTPAISGNRLVALLGRNRGFVGCRIDAKGYQVLWKNADYTLKGGAATGIINDGWFFAVVNPTVWPGTVTEQAIGIELATGKVVGPVPFEGVAQSLATSPAGMDGRWFFHVGAGYSGMVMMKASGTDFTQVGLRMPTVKSWMPLPGGSKTKDKLDYCLTSTPAMAGGLVFFRGSDSLYCYDLRRPSEEDLARIRQARRKQAEQLVKDFRAGKVTAVTTVQELVRTDFRKMAETLLVEEMRAALSTRDAQKFETLAASSIPLGPPASALLGPLVNKALMSGSADMARAAMAATGVLAGEEAERAKPVLEKFLRGKTKELWGPASVMWRSIDDSADRKTVQEMSRFGEGDDAATVLAAINVIGSVAARTREGALKKVIVDILKRLLAHKDMACQKAAIGVLAALGPEAKAAVNKLEELLIVLPDLAGDIEPALDKIVPSRTKLPEPGMDLPSLDL